MATDLLRGTLNRIVQAETLDDASRVLQDVSRLLIDLFQEALDQVNIDDL